LDRQQATENGIETLNRRELIAFGASSLLPLRVLGQRAMPTRRIPSTGEEIPVIGLGSSKPVQEIEARGIEPISGVLRTLIEHGGKLVDTWPRNPDNDGAFGEVLASPEFRDALFVTTKIDQVGAEAGTRQFDQTLELYRRDTIDLVQIFSLTDVDTHWPNLRRWKDEGRARYIGVTVAESRLYEPLRSFLERESPDFVQINYSITERESETELLPMLADRGIAVIINRPFMNGRYFDELENTPLPDWTAEFDCGSWAQFSLKYILANPNFTCVLTETSNPVHMAENASTAFGPLPSETARRRMREFIDAV
jgi:diketogulonate reductase-like aldo/keto reductase